MQSKAFWKYGLVAGAIGLSTFAGPARSQQPDPSSPTAGDAKSYVEYGAANGAKGDLPTAIQAFTEAIKINPVYAPAFYNRGVAYSLENNLDAAAADFNRTIQLSPKFKEAYFQRGDLKARRGDLPGAIADFSQVLKLDPKFAPAYHNRAHARYFLDDLDDALNDINQALALDPNSAYGYFTRGLIRHALQHRAEAAADFQKSAGLDFPYASFWIWIIEMENNNPGLARQDLLRALTVPAAFAPNDWPSQIGSFLLGKISQDQLLAQAKTLDPGAADQHLCEAWFYAGMVRRFSGDLKGAQLCFSNSVATGQRDTDEFVEARREAAQEHRR